MANNNPTEITSIDIKKEVAVKRVIPDDLRVTYSDGMVIKNQDGLFNLYFFQSRWPIAITPEEMEAIDSVEARCVAHLVITPEQMKKNIDALIENFRKFEQRLQELINAEETARKENKEG
jgi:hypothetical protein